MSNNLIPTTFSNEFTAGNVKAAMKDAGAGSGDLYKVPVDKLVVMPGLNVRAKTDEYEAHIESIAQSILENGFYANQPLGVIVDEQGRVIVHSGHSRLEAAKRAIKRGAQIETLPVVTSPRGTTMEDVTVGLVTNNTGKPLAPIEVAVVVKRMIGWGRTEEDVAKRLGMTKGYVSDLLRLLEAPEALKQLVSAGKVAAGAAIKTIKKVGAAEATKQIVEASKSSEDGKVKPKDIKAKQAESEKAPAPPKAHISAAAAKVPGPVFSEAALKKILLAVFNDKGFNKLSDKTQSAVIEVVG